MVAKITFFLNIEEADYSTLVKRAIQVGYKNSSGKWTDAEYTAAIRFLVQYLVDAELK